MLKYLDSLKGMDTAYKRKVLVVDDDPAMRKFVRGALANGRYEVIEAGNGDEALHRLASDKPDIMLLDLIMPGIDGFEVCKILREEMNDFTTPVIILSAVAEKKDVLRGLNAGANDYIQKPVDAFELKAKINSNLRFRDLYDNSNIEKNDLLTLLDVSRALSSSLSSNEILDIIVRKVAEIINVNRCSIIKIGKKKGVGYVLTSHDNPEFRNSAIDLDKYPEIKKAIKTKDMVIIDNVFNDPMMAEVKDYLKGAGFKSILLVPIVLKEKAVGVFLLRTSRKEKSFTQREVRLCQVIATLTSIALANARLYESVERTNSKLERLAITDGLTGIYNHRYFRSRLEDEFNRAERYDTPLSCIMLDIDFFKKINDTFGHKQGDVILKEVAKVIKNHIRKTDMVFRYGGEEFTVLLPQTDKDGALIEAERIRTAIKGYRCLLSVKAIKITISCGVATFPYSSKKIKSGDDLVGLADKALYEAKQSGRDRTVTI